jgi:fructose-specific phosphotransferase system IIC component
LLETACFSSIGTLVPEGIMSSLAAPGEAGLTAGMVAGAAAVSGLTAGTVAGLVAGLDWAGAKLARHNNANITRI